MTKKEIVKKISEDIGLTQLKTKDIVQRTLDAIIQTLVSEGRIELRNFGVFEVKTARPRKARNPRTGDKVYVPSKNVVTFKPGKEMEELVRKMDPRTFHLRKPTPMPMKITTDLSSRWPNRRPGRRPTEESPGSPVDFRPFGRASVAASDRT